MLNYYKRNHPRQSGADAPPAPELPKVQAPVLMFYGLRDTALHSDGLAGTWNWVAKDLTLVSAPRSGSLRSAGRGGSRHDDDEVVAVESREQVTAELARDTAGATPVVDRLVVR